jgi:hypothetical protein
MLMRLAGDLISHLAPTLNINHVRIIAKCALVRKIETVEGWVKKRPALP